MSLLAVATLQLLAFAAALLGVGIAGVRGVRLAQLAAAHPGASAWWQGDTARRAIIHAVRPLWWTITALVIGAALPQLALMLAGT
ncbi:hypothetical protein [Xanthomonas arboricola]|uniref:Uncharacterized protein n=4 Tax=Xanthomonas arboricola pv. pruni TaxID=69929 RepID=A0AAQ0W527_9XANT|nr:hypothetical protein [Xanthomonas arboricola]GAE49982.1 hypothetical protein XPU_1514 [Xanthomonas arboricola pv. pruni str. MAFF 311562]GAE57021.1 hypothetical protein XPR_3656 [Xanthomonas arboricola pv. pruni MAFF 301420]GAE59834.1 hypothetical protein XPN_1740 [Xanthomonas arboricola pv. pruni MAFF 301427]KCX00064.1 hypothetical protein DK27_20200 [Xanthomonas arboricola pv. pruni]KPN09120.1 hypothetical protein AN652_16605 [Xanthomonas arboricola pv. pruni]